MEFNKIAAAILLAGLIGMVTGKVSGFLYGGGDEAAHHGEEHHEEARGYSIDVPEGGVDTSGGAAVEENLPSIIPLLASADVAKGEAFFSKKCTLCHSADNGGGHKTGPNLWGVMGRAKGSAAGFSYSKAMQEAGGSWSFDDMSGFLHKPKKWLPGTIMAFAGVGKDQDRADLIMYLRSQSSSPIAIPAAPAEPKPTAEEAPAEEANAEKPAAEEEAAEEAPADETAE